ncbi:MAG: hypothetical protein IH933_08280 [Euryarchaeota archaeon]|nr:hypothetical protein [Euryarchaeota archaeon]
MSSTPQPQPARATRPTTTPTNDTRSSPAGAQAMFDTDCCLRLGCLIDAENRSVSPAWTTGRE